MKETWTAYRKLMANLVPACFFVPLFAAGLLLFQRGHVSLALALFAATPVAGWLAVNSFGLFENRKMKAELRRLLDGVAGAVFVGFAPPGRVSALDPHQDLGWLLIHPDRIEFRGERATHVMMRGEIGSVRFRPNVHSLVGLGRWISIEGTRNGKPVRMLIEPRERSTLLANRKLGAQLLDRLLSWMNSPHTSP
jgi:hypothetical protein